MKKTKKNAFTLIELLAVAMLIAIVLVIAIPNVRESLISSYDRAYSFDLDALQRTAKDFLLKKSVELDDGDKAVVTVSQMVNEGLIEEIKDPQTKELCDGYVIASRTADDYSYDPYLKCGDSYLSDNYGNISDIIPVITILGNNPTNINMGENYIDAGATAKDYHDTDITSKIVVTNPVKTAIPGSYNVTYTVTDNIGNENTATRIVNVMDTDNPIITFEPNNSDPTYIKSRETVIKASDVGGLNNNSLKYVWAASGEDPSEDEFTSPYKSNQVITTPTEVEGIYYLWAMASDKTGNKTVANSGAFYIDNLGPTITVNGSNPVTVSKGSTYTDAGATATDNYSGVSESIISSGIVNTNIIGTYYITYNVKDTAGNAAIPVIRTIHVVDVLAPVITVLGTNPMTINYGATYTDAGATAYDDVDGDVTSKIVTTGEVCQCYIGTYIITYTVTDNAGNTATATRSVTVKDNIPPSITFGTNGNSTWAKSRSSTITVSDPQSGVNTSSLKYQWSTSTTTPLCTSFTTTFTNGASVTSTPGLTGSYYLWALAKDNSGQTAIVKTNVFKLDNTVPTITLNGSSTITMAIGSTYSDAGATATDANSGINGSVTATGTVNPNVAGTYTITYNVSDNAGNAAVPVIRTINVITDYDASKGVNTPALATGMTPIKWNGSAWVDTTTYDTDWFNYTTTDKKWANARTADGSMWVWIPRYIYKVSSNWHVNTTGTIDIQFSRGTNDNWNSSVIGNISSDATSNSSNNTWTNHPAFTFGSNELTGIWVAKFEATASEGVVTGYTSDQSCVAGDDVTTKTVKILPNTRSWRCIQIGRAFTVSRNIETNSVYGWGTSGSGIDTHMIKNTEWGAVAYLSKSQYGKNTEEVYVNNNKNYITGCAGNTASESKYDGCQNSYESTGGVKASTTGNIYGIYDMSGGALEFAAAYVNNGNGDLLQGSNITGAAAQYKDVYAKGTTDDGINNYALAINHKGDAIYETSNSYSGTNSWFSDSSWMPGGNNPWFLRCNTFSFDSYWGGSGSSYGFRPVLLVKTGI